MWLQSVNLTGFTSLHTVALTLLQHHGLGRWTQLSCFLCCAECCWVIQYEHLDIDHFLLRVRNFDTGVIIILSYILPNKDTFEHQDSLHIGIVCKLKPLLHGKLIKLILFTMSYTNWLTLKVQSSGIITHQYYDKSTWDNIKPNIVGTTHPYCNWVPTLPV